ncbi:2-phospho-L-lactate transferase CofD family protein [Micromonospora sp. LOL_021]|uniref:2-phospho-L-lactate transferase CofD family protein n=1 Tax=Micromonospora sp. LOL_021 TaxID=3345417 RepID=UPI003A84C954
MRIVVLTGGIGGAKFLVGAREYARRTGAELTAVVNVGDDVILHGLRISPDLDSVMYTLGGGADPERGWGRVGETWAVKNELAAYQAEPTWFGLGDRDVATHLVRTTMLNAGYPLSAVTEALCARWQPGLRLLPATDDRLETHVVVSDPGPGPGPGQGQGQGQGQGSGQGQEQGPDAGGERAIHFQEWWVRHRGALPTHRFVFVGAAQAKPAAGVLDALAAADVVLIAPSNPVVSIAPVLAVPGIREALAGNPAPVVGVSPIIGDAPVRGMADRCLAVLGEPCTAAGVAALYGARRAGGLLDGWLVDPVDEVTRVDGIEVRAVPLWMSDAAATAAMVGAAIELAGRPTGVAG